MNLNQPIYNQFNLCHEMMETVEVIRAIIDLDLVHTIRLLQRKHGLFITGEGSSRIVPAKNLIYRNLVNGSPIKILTEEATQSMEYDLSDFAVIAISNSGKTREVIRLLKLLEKKGHDVVVGISANERSLMEQHTTSTLVLNCGKENAVAATKSVVEQALLLDRIYHLLTQNNHLNFESLAEVFQRVLMQSVDTGIVKKLAKADMLYFAGRNTGVVEELTLKTNEIARKKADFLEGTYCLHGIEEVMTKNEAAVLIDPFPEEEDNIYDALVKGVGIEEIAIAPRLTRFQTILIPHCKGFDHYIQLAAGWNLLVEIGVELGIDLDKPVRARKVGNEFKPKDYGAHVSMNRKNITT